MSTMTRTPNQATTEQLKRLASCKDALRERFLHSGIKDGHLLIDYRTSGGFYCRAFYGATGEQVSKNYYHGYSLMDNQPFDPVFKTR